MSRRDFWICIAIIILIFTLGVMVGMCVQVLGVPAHASAVVEDVGGSYVSGMPCENPEQFARWYESYSEAAEAVGSEQEAAKPIIYRIAGEEVDVEIQTKLYYYLDAEGIAYWYEGALAQMYQESHCKQYAENPNGLDKGIFQYRITYWDWSDGDIFDLDAQMRKYAAEMAVRFNAGLSVDEAISRHNTSDYITTVNWEYVAQVKQWLTVLQKN